MHTETFSKPFSFVRGRGRNQRLGAVCKDSRSGINKHERTSRSNIWGTSSLLTALQDAEIGSNSELAHTSDVQGDVNTSDVQGDVNTSDVQGDVNTSDVQGDVNTLDVQGDVNTLDVQGDVNTSDVQGDVRHEQGQISDMMDT
jgi:hypothetical protein